MKMLISCLLKSIVFINSTKGLKNGHRKIRTIVGQMDHVIQSIELCMHPNPHYTKLLELSAWSTLLVHSPYTTDLFN